MYALGLYGNQQRHEINNKWSAFKQLNHVLSKSRRLAAFEVDELRRRGLQDLYLRAASRL